MLDVALPDSDVPALPSRLDVLTHDLRQIWGAVISNPNTPATNCHPASDKWVSLPEFAEAESTPQCPLRMELWGPYGFGAAVMPYAIDFNHVSSWRYFLNENVVVGYRDYLRRSSLLFAHAFGSRRIAYLADQGIDILMAADIKSFDEALVRLRQEWGSPGDLSLAYEVKAYYWHTYFHE